MGGGYLHDLLADLEAWVRDFIVMSDEAVSIVAVWIAHTWVFEAFETTPRLWIRSPVRESGKTRLLEILRATCRDPLMGSNVSAAALFRSTDAGHPTILLDELDNFLSAADRSDRADIVGLINDGYWINGATLRCVGDSNNVRKFSTFAPIAMAGLSAARVPDTTMSRSFIIDMHRKRPDETVKRYRLREQAERSKQLRDRFEEWAAAVKPVLSDARPVLPDELGDRQQDCLEPLAAIADAAGGDWPERVRNAAVELHKIASGRTVNENTLAERLLTDLRDVFDGKDRLPTTTVLERLWKIDEAPWADMPDTGKPLDARGLAALLKPWGVTSKNVKVGGVVLKGYRTDVLADLWVRYPPPPSATSATGATSTNQPAETEDPVAEAAATHALPGSGTPAGSGPVAERPATESGRSSGGNGQVAEVAAETHPGVDPCKGCGQPAASTSATGGRWCATCWPEGLAS
jgi:hypothetical protein